MSRYSYRDRWSPRCLEPGEDAGAGPPKDQGGWAFLTADLLNSPAWLSPSVNAYRVLSCLMSGHLGQGRRAIGNLTVPHGQFREAGACADLIAGAIDELIFNGLLRVQAGGLPTHPAPK